ncbi:MAG: carboxypeptidase regulatory-like domain-containing protein, partial [Caldilineae bacterium]
RLAQTAFALANRYFTDTQVAWADIVDEKIRRVAFFHPATRERRLLVWALGPENVTAFIPAVGPSARLIRLDGSEITLTPVNGGYTLELAGATNRNWPNNRGGYDIGIYGEPVLLIEEDVTPPEAQVQPLPEQSWPEVTVSWEAVDWGVGLESVELWVQVNGAGWQLWQSGLPAQGQALYQGAPGQQVAFAAVGVDRLGQANRNLTPQAWTNIIEKPTHANVNGRVFDPAGQPVAGVQVNIGGATGVTNEQGDFQLTAPLGVWDIWVEGRPVIRGRDFNQDATVALLYSRNPNVVLNGDFEQGGSGWNTGGSSPLAMEQQPGTQDHAAHLATAFTPNPGVPGAEGSNGGNSTLHQRIQVPYG